MRGARFPVSLSILAICRVIFLATAHLARAQSSSTPTITSITGASGFGAAKAVAPGSWIQIYGANLAPDARPWASSDFIEASAPLSLDGVSVTIGGQEAFVSYISSQQVNALLPSTILPGSQSVSVTNANGTSNSLTITVNQTEPLLWTPSNFNINGTQYVGAVFPDFATFVLPVGAVPGLPSRPAGPGDTIILLGIGFGPTTPSIPAGEIATQATQLDYSAQISLGQTPVATAYAGLAPNEVGLYQFNVQIPAGLPSGAVPLSLLPSSPGATNIQGLWIALSQTPSLQINGVQDLAGDLSLAVPGNMVLIQGNGFAQNASTESYPLPTSLGGIQVNFSGFPAPIASASPQQLEVQVPWELLGQSSATLSVVNASTGAAVSMPVTVQTAMPAVPSAGTGFSIQIEGSGGASPAPSSPGSNNRPVMPGEFLDIPAIGLGLSANAPADGQAASATYPGNPEMGVMISIGSAWAPVSSAALVPGAAGVSMLRVQVPINASTGDSVPLVISAWGMTSAPVQIAVGASTTPAFAISLGDAATDGCFPVSLTGNVTSNQLAWTAQALNTPSIEDVYQLALVENVNSVYGSSNITSYCPGFFDAYILPEYILLTATLSSEPTIFATARVLFTSATGATAPTFQIVPQNPVIGPSGSVAFQAVDSNGNPVQVTWSMGSNVFTASTDGTGNPTKVQATASDGTAAETFVFITPSAPQVLSLSPPNPAPGTPVSINTSGLPQGSYTVYFSRLDGTFTSVASKYLTVIVPPDAVEGPMVVAAQAASGPPVQTPPFEAAISPPIRLRAEQIEVAPGGSVQIDPVLLFDPRPRDLTWSAEIGSISASGVFTAPNDVYPTGSGVVNQPQYVNVSACFTDRNICGYTVVAIQPFLVSPSQPVIALGGSVSLQAAAGGTAILVTWKALTSNITISAQGVVQAMSTSSGGGVAQVMATNSSGVSRVINIAVTGSQGGMVHVERDLLNWVDWTETSPLGPTYLGVVTVGNRAYVLANNVPDNSGVAGDPTAWIDTWDITDPVNPMWLASTGAAVGKAPQLTKFSGGLLVTGPTDFDTSGFGSLPQTIGLSYSFDSNGIPVFSAYDDTGTLGGDYINYALSPITQGINGNTGYTVYGYGVYQQNLATLSAPQLVLTLPAAYDPGGVSATGDGQRLYVAAGTGQIFTYNVTVNPPALVSTVDITPSESVNLFLMGSLLLCNSGVYTVSNGVPQFASQLPTTTIVDADPLGMRVLGLSTVGATIFNLTDPANPQVLGPSQVLGLVFEASFALAPGNAFVSTNGELETYSATPNGGPQVLSAFSPDDGVLDEKTSGNEAFLATGVLQIYDISSPSSPQLIGAYIDYTQSAYGVQLSGNYAFLVCDNDFLVIDVSNPAAPTLATALPISTGSALGMIGSTAIVGAFNGNTPVMMTLNVSNPTAPSIIGQVALTGGVFQFATNGNTVAVAEGSSGLALFDLSVPGSPAQLWALTDGTVANAVTWSGNLLYIAANQGLIVYDATNPHSPMRLGSNTMSYYQFNYLPCCLYYATTPGAYSVYVDGNVAWVGASTSFATLMGLDVSAPAAPRVISQIEFSNSLDTAVLSIGPAGSNLFIGGAFGFPSEAAYLMSANPPANVILPAPAQTSPGDPALLPNVYGTSTQSAAAANVSQAQSKQPSALARKLSHWPEPYRDREMKAHGLQ